MNTMQVNLSKPPFSCFLLPKNGERGSEPPPIFGLSCLDRVFCDWPFDPLSKVTGCDILVPCSILPKLEPVAISPLVFSDDRDEKLLFELRCLLLLPDCPLVPTSMIIISKKSKISFNKDSSCGRFIGKGR